MKRLAIAALVFATLKPLWIIGCANGGNADLESRFAFLEHELRSDSAGNSMIGGEWFLVSLSMTGLAAAQLAIEHPETATDRLHSVEALVERALEKATRAFDTKEWRTDALATLDTNEGHAGYLGHLGLLLGTECALGGHQHEALRHRVAAALERRFLAAPNGLLQTYPGDIWLADNTAALAGTALMLRCEGRQPPNVMGKWPIDPKTGLFPFTQHVASRGSSAGWNSIYLPFIDEAIASEQFEKAQAAFGVSGLGFAAWREFPHGVEGSGDVDSGPLIFGLSPAGTGFAIAGATRSRPELALEMVRIAEAAGFTVPWGAGRHYLLAPRVGEAAVLAARTARSWETLWSARALQAESRNATRLH